MMFGLKKKKQSISHQYFARIEQGSLNFETGNLQEIADSTGTFSEDWPNVSLQDLQDFLSRATNDVIRAGSHDLHMQRISYMSLNEKGQPEPTGLSWENVIIDAGFENFVVSTADQILNDAEVRQDEEMTFDIIMTALLNLQDAALTYTDLSLEDMPALPTEEVYHEAQETGERLEVQPTRFNQFTVVTPNEDVIQDAEKVSAPSEESFSEPLYNPQDAFSESVINDNQTDLNDTGQTVQNAAQPTKPAETIEQTTSPTQKLVDSVDIQTPLFVVEGEVKSLPADNEHYVMASLNAEKQKANTFLTEISNVLTREVQSKLANLLKERQKIFGEKLDAIENTNVQDAVTNQLNNERQAEYDARFHQRKTAREASYHADVAAENDRHEQTLVNLKNTYVEDLENLKTVVTQELDNWYLERSLILTNDLSQQLKDRATSAKQEFEAATLAELTEVSNKLIVDNAKSLREMHEKLSSDLDNKQQKFEAEHLQALEQMTKLTSIQNEAKNVGALEKQVQVLKQANIELEQRLKAKDIEQTENSALLEIRQQLAQLQTQPNKTDQLNDQLMKLLSQKMVPSGNPSSEKRRSSFWKSFAVGSLVVLALGGVGIGSYALAMNQQKPTTTKSATSISSKQESFKTITVLPQAASTPQSASVSQDNASSSSNNTSNQQSSLNNRFHVGDQVNVIINGKNVTAPIKAVSDSTITVYYDGYDYVVPMS